MPLPTVQQAPRDSQCRVSAGVVTHNRCSQRQASDHGRRVKCWFRLPWFRFDETRVARPYRKTVLTRPIVWSVAHDELKSTEYDKIERPSL